MWFNLQENKIRLNKLGELIFELYGTDVGLVEFFLPVGLTDLLVDTDCISS